MSGTRETATSETGPRRLGQVRGLDGLRGVAVLVVVLSHTNPLMPYSWTGTELRRSFDGGWLGVDMFFVLSGFLITALLLDEQSMRSKIRFGAFYMRRALRLLPALYFMLACYAVYTLVTGLSTGPMWKSTLSAVLYSTNWQAIYRPLSMAEGLGHLWSLAVEEQFYLIWPLLLAAFFGMNRRARWVVPAMVVLIAGLAINRAVAWNAGEGWITGFVRTDFRADSLLIGALMAQLWVRRLTPRRGLTALSWIALAAMAFMVWNADAATGVWYRGGMTAFAACMAIVVLGVVEGVWRPGAGFEHGSLRFLGRISYGLYLWHLPVIRAVSQYGATWPSPQRVVVATAITAAGVAVSWFLVEQPALRLKRRWEVRDLAPRPTDGGPDLAVAGHVPPATH